MSSSCSRSQEKVPSNLESFLRSVTPVVRTKTLSVSLQQGVGDEKIEYFTLGDLWKCYEEWSAYGVGTPVAVKSSDTGSETVVQYYAPCLSAIQLYTKSDKREDGKPASDLSETASERDTFGYPYLEYSETISPYWRLPFCDKIADLAIHFPGLKSLKSTDLSPASWMSVAWSPIYHIPREHVEEFTTYFLTYHTLSSSFEDGQGSNGICLPGVNEKVVKAKSENKMSLPPFGLSSMRMQEHIWINPAAGDRGKLISLHSAAESWLKQLEYDHHDFAYYQQRYLEVELEVENPTKSG